MIKHFREIVVWQKSHQLVMDIYQVTKYFPKEEIYGLTSQMRRASSPVPANIVEGFTRESIKEQKRFYEIADGSLAELKYFLILSFDLGCLNRSVFEKLLQKAEEVGRLLYGWKSGVKSRVR